MIGTDALLTDFFREPECTFDDRAPLRDIINPGIYDLREYDGFSDSVSSYQCV